MGDFNWHNNHTPVSVQTSVAKLSDSTGSWVRRWFANRLLTSCFKFFTCNRQSITTANLKACTDERKVSLVFVSCQCQCFIAKHRLEFCLWGHSFVLLFSALIVVASQLFAGRGSVRFLVTWFFFLACWHFFYFQVGRVFIPTVIVHVSSIYGARNRKKLVTGCVICIPSSFTTLLLANVRHFTSLSNCFGSIKQFLSDQVVTKLLVLHYMLNDVRVLLFSALPFVCA